MLKHLYKYLILPVILLILFASFSASTDEPCDCKKFTNGDFIYHLHGPKGDIFFSINRKDSIQTEKDKHSGYYSKLHVKWITDCKYEALLLETTYPFPDSVQHLRKTVPLEVEITACTKEYYIFEAHRGQSPSMTDTMWVDK